MVFTPRYQEAEESEIIENLMAVIDRDMKSALDYFYAGDSLPDFAVKTDGEVSVFNYPLLSIGLERMTSSETDDIDETDESFLSQDLRIGMGMLVSDATSLKNARIRARKYVRALKSVIRSASLDDLMASTAQVLIRKIDIEHRYLRHGTKGTDLLQPVEFEVRIQYGET